MLATESAFHGIAELLRWDLALCEAHCLVRTMQVATSRQPQVVPTTKSACNTPQQSATNITTVAAVEQITRRQKNVPSAIHLLCH